MDYRIVASKGSLNSAAQEDELLDDWEQMADSGLMDKKIQNIRNRPSSTSVQSTASHFLFQQDGTVKALPVGPPPQIKILKRPQNGTGPNGNYSPNTGSGNGQKPKPPAKTLEQKEAEYARARLRILGEAAPPVPTNEVTVAKLQGKFEGLRTDEPSASGVVRLPKGPDGTRGFQGRANFT